MSIYDNNAILIYCTVVAFIFGACMGSFLNCTAIRICKGEAFVKGRSHCVSCGHDLCWKDLIPIVSWVLLGGKCRYCGAKISARYPLTEVAFGLVTAACLLKFDFTILCARNFVFLAMLFLLTLTDIDSMEIPDSCHVIMALAWIVTAPFIYSMPEIGVRAAAALVFGGGVLALSCDGSCDAQRHSWRRRHQASRRCRVVFRLCRNAVCIDTFMHSWTGL